MSISLKLWQIVMMMIITTAVLYEINKNIAGIYAAMGIISCMYWYYKIKSAKEELRKHPDAFRRPLDTFSNNERITIDKS